MPARDIERDTEDVRNEFISLSDVIANVKDFGHSAWRWKWGAGLILALCCLAAVQKVWRPASREFIVTARMGYVGPPGNGTGDEWIQQVRARMVSHPTLERTVAALRRSHRASSQEASGENSSVVEDNDVSLERLRNSLSVEIDPDSSLLTISYSAADESTGIAVVEFLLSDMEDHAGQERARMTALYGSTSLEKLVEELRRLVEERESLRRDIPQGNARPVSALQRIHAPKILDVSAPTASSVGEPSGRQADVLGLASGESEVGREPDDGTVEPLEGWTEAGREALGSRLSFIDKKIDAIRADLRDLDRLQLLWPNYEIHQPPIAELAPPSFSIQRTLAMHFLVGFSLACVFVIVADRLDDRFRSPEELAARVGASVLCTLRNPNSSGKGEARGSSSIESGDANALQLLEFSLARQLDPSRRTVLCVGIGSDGTRLAEGLAGVAANQSKSVLLVDADVCGRPTTHDSTEVPSQVAPYIARRKDGVDFLSRECSGDNSKKIGEVALQIPEILEWATSHYDFAFVALPSLTDEVASVFAAATGYPLLLVVEPGRETRRRITSAVAKLRSFGAAIQGIVALGPVPYPAWRISDLERGLQDGAQTGNAMESVAEPLPIASFAPFARDSARTECG